MTGCGLIRAPALLVHTGAAPSGSAAAAADAQVAAETVRKANMEAATAAAPTQDPEGPIRQSDASALPVHDSAASMATAAASNGSLELPKPAHAYATPAALLGHWSRRGLGKHQQHGLAGGDTSPHSRCQGMQAAGNAGVNTEAILCIMLLVLRITTVSQGRCARLQKQDPAMCSRSMTGSWHVASR